MKKGTLYRDSDYFYGTYFIHPRNHGVPWVLLLRLRIELALYRESPTHKPGQTFARTLTAQEQ
jgi:hypothetical protein